MWGYFENDKCIATNPNDMSGNTGWKEVPVDMVPVLTDEVSLDAQPTTLEERQDQLEAALIELAGIIGGG